MSLLLEQALPLLPLLPSPWLPLSGLLLLARNTILSLASLLLLLLLSLLLLLLSCLMARLALSVLVTHLLQPPLLSDVSALRLTVAAAPRVRHCSWLCHTRSQGTQLLLLLLLLCIDLALPA